MDVEGLKREKEMFRGDEDGDGDDGGWMREDAHSHSQLKRLPHYTRYIQHAHHAA